MSVYTFPAARPPAVEAGASCTLWWIRAALGRTDTSDARFVAYVQCLVDQYGFPPPFPSAIKGKGLVRAVTAKSTFRRDAVEAWLDDFLPPACAQRLDAAAQRRAAEELDDRAASLGAIRLVPGGRA